MTGYSFTLLVNCGMMKAYGVHSAYAKLLHCKAQYAAGTWFSYVLLQLKIIYWYIAYIEIMKWQVMLIQWYQIYGSIACIVNSSEVIFIPTSGVMVKMAACSWSVSKAYAWKGYTFLQYFFCVLLQFCLLRMNPHHQNAMQNKFYLLLFE